MQEEFLKLIKNADSEELLYALISYEQEITKEEDNERLDKLNFKSSAIFDELVKRLKQNE